jgi:hypothetical protein
MPILIIVLATLIALVSAGFFFAGWLQVLSWDEDRLPELKWPVGFLVVVDVLFTMGLVTLSWLVFTRGKRDPAAKRFLILGGSGLVVSLALAVIYVWRGY